MKECCSYWKNNIIGKTECGVDEPIEAKFCPECGECFSPKYKKVGRWKKVFLIHKDALSELVRMDDTIILYMDENTDLFCLPKSGGGNFYKLKTITGEDSKQLKK